MGWRWGWDPGAGDGGSLYLVSSPNVFLCCAKFGYGVSQTQTDSDKVYSTKIYTSTISGLHEFLRNTNNTIVLIYQ